MSTDKEKSLWSKWKSLGAHYRWGITVAVAVVLVWVFFL